MGEISEAQFQAAMAEGQTQESAEPTTEETAATEGQSEERQPAEPEPEKPKDKFATRFAALAKREGKLRQLEEAHKQRATELEARAKEFDELKSVLKSDPIEALKRLGYSYDDLTRTMLGREQDPREAIEAAKREAIEAAREEARKLQQEQEQGYQRAEIERRVSAFKSEAAQVAKSEFKLIAKYSPAEIGNAAIQLAQKVYNETGEVLSTRAAVERIESQLKAQLQWLAEDNPVAGTATPAVQASDSRANRKPSPSTLTNSQAADAVPGKKLSRAERIKAVSEGKLGWE